MPTTLPISPTDEVTLRLFSYPGNPGRRSHADVAIAELNAAVLGSEAALGVEAIAIATGPSPFFRRPSYIDHIRFSIRIPGYNSETSAYFWKLTLHRDIDIRKSEIAGGVAVARQDYHASAPSQEVMTDSMTPLQTEALGKPFEVDEPIKIIKPLTAADGNIIHVMIINGGVTETSAIEFKKIVAATLTLIYWPDRDQPESFAHIVRVEQA